jgi:class 3 adenylate cyclase
MFLFLASVMFTDVKNYKSLITTLGSHADAVTLLNTLFHHMDELRKSYESLERIKTINSKVLIVGGLQRDDGHLKQLLDMALDMQELFESEWIHERAQLDDITGSEGDSEGNGDVSVMSEDERKVAVKLSVGFGIHMGPLVAGIVGKKTFCYEVYGDTVNTSSRMLSIANGGEIVVSETVWESVKYGKFY